MCKILRLTFGVKITMLDIAIKKIFVSFNVFTQLVSCQMALGYFLRWHRKSISYIYWDCFPRCLACTRVHRRCHCFPTLSFFLFFFNIESSCQLQGDSKRLWIINLFKEYINIWWKLYLYIFLVPHRGTFWNIFLK